MRSVASPARADGNDRPGREAVREAAVRASGPEPDRRYYTPRPVPESDLKLMRRIDELHLRWPFYGARRLARERAKQGFDVGRLHVATLMRRMGIEARYRKPRTSIPARGGSIYPYLLGGLSIERPNQA
jgi:putative transposase